MILASIGSVVAVVAAAHYLNTIATEQVPESVAPHSAAFALGAGLSLAGAVLSPGILSALIAAVGLSTGGLMLYLMRIRKLPDGELIAKVGAPMPPVQALDEHGAPFDLSSLKGKRILFKFFRGSW